MFESIRHTNYYLTPATALLTILTFIPPSLTLPQLSPTKRHISHLYNTLSPPLPQLS